MLLSLFCFVTTGNSFSDPGVRILFYDNFNHYSGEWGGDLENLSGSINAHSGASRQGNIFGWHATNEGENQRVTLSRPKQSPWSEAERGLSIAAVRNDNGTAIPNLFNYFTNRSQLPGPGNSTLNLTGSVGFPLQDGNYEITFDVMAASSLGGQPLFRFFDSSGELALRLYMPVSGDFIINDTTVAENIFGPNEWYRFEITQLNINTGLFDLRVLAWENGNVVTLFEQSDLALSSPIADIELFRFSANSNNPHEHYLDNFRIQQRRLGHPPEVTPGATFFVSPNGDDTNAGTKESPFATLDQARLTVRSLIESEGLPSGGITVYLRGGTYFVDGQTRFGLSDSGAPHAPIVYRAYGNERPRFVGGVSLDGAAFAPVTDPNILERIPEIARAGVMVIDLNGLNLDFGEIPFRGHSLFSQNWLQPRGPESPELVINGDLMTLARWPNEGFSTFPDVIEEGSIPRDGDSPDDPDFKTPVLGFADWENERASRWASAPDAWVFGYWGVDWSDQSMQIDSVSAGDKTVALAQASTYGIRENHRFFVFNLLEELDSPGEWYLDRADGKLYIYPQVDLETAEIVLTQIEEPILFLNNVSHLIFRDLVFESGRGSGIVMSGASHNLIQSCVIRNFGDRAVVVDGGENNGIQSSRIYNLGRGGLRLTGGDRDNLIPGGHFAQNNLIHDFARLERTYNPAVHVLGVGQVVAHNEIFNGPHMGLRYSGNNHLFEYNEIYDVIQETDDMGAIYAGRRWDWRGNIIRYNIFHSLVGLEGEVKTFPIYFDDGMSSALVKGNIIVGAADDAVVIGGGHHIDVRNNLFVECDRPVVMDNRLERWGSRFMPTILNALDPFLGNPVWLEAYPELADLFELSHDPEAPHNNVIQNNFLYQSGDFITVRPALNSETNNFFSSANPGFANPDNFDFSIPRDSWLFEIFPDFQRLPFEHIGLYRDKVNHTPALGGFSKTNPLHQSDLLATSTPELSWQAAENASLYTVRIARNSEMSEVIAEVVTPETFASLPNLEGGREYFWDVVALSDQPGWVEGQRRASGLPRSFVFKSFEEFQDSADLNESGNVAGWHPNINSTSANQRGWFVNRFDEFSGAILTGDQSSPWPESDMLSIALARFAGATAPARLEFHFSSGQLEQGGEVVEISGFPGFLLEESGYRIAWDFYTANFATQPRWTLQDPSGEIAIRLQVHHQTRTLQYSNGSEEFSGDFVFQDSTWYRFELVDVNVPAQKWTLNVYKWDAMESEQVAVMVIRNKSFKNPVSALQRFVMQSWSQSNHLYFIDNFSINQTLPMNLTLRQWFLRQRDAFGGASLLELPAAQVHDHLLTFALAESKGDPRRPVSPGLRRTSEEGRAAVDFIFRRNPFALGLSWKIEESIDLIEWTPLEMDDSVIIENYPGRLRLRKSISELSGDPRFFRLGVEAVDELIVPELRDLALFDFQSGVFSPDQTIVDSSLISTNGWSVSPLVDQASGTGALGASNQSETNRNLLVAPQAHLSLSSNRESDQQTPLEEGGNNNSTWLSFSISPEAGRSMDFNGASLSIDTIATSSLSGTTGATWSLYYRRSSDPVWVLLGTSVGAFVSGSGQSNFVTLNFDLSPIGSEVDESISFLIDPSTVDYSTNGTRSQRSIGFTNLRVNGRID